MKWKTGKPKQTLPFPFFPFWAAKSRVKLHERGDLGQQKDSCVIQMFSSHDAQQKENASAGSYFFENGYL